MSWVVYILKCNDASFYTGITTDIDRRLKEHNEGVGAKYTRARRPVSLIFTEDHQNRSHASKREYEIKSLSRKQKEQLAYSK